MSRRVWTWLGALALVAGCAVLALALLTGYDAAYVTALRAAAVMGMLAAVGAWMSRRGER